MPTFSVAGSCAVSLSGRAREQTHSKIYSAIKNKTFLLQLRFEAFIITSESHL